MELGQFSGESCAAGTRKVWRPRRSLGHSSGHFVAAARQMCTQNRQPEGRPEDRRRRTEVGFGLKRGRRMPLPPQALGPASTLRSHATFDHTALTLLHAMLLLLGTASGSESPSLSPSLSPSQSNCHGIADSGFCGLFYAADPANFCANE